jgi:hypothetical protein
MRVPEPTLPRRLAFALFVGGALGAVAWWRGWWPLAVLGGALVLVTPVTPLSSALYRGWMRLGLLLSRVTTPPLMLLLYVVVVLPVALLSRAAGRDPLRLRARRWGDRRASTWEARAPRDPASYLRQY